MSASTGRLAFATGWLAVAAQAVWAWSRWPDRVPMHFGVAGDVDRWGTATEFFVVWGIVLGMLALIFGALPLVIARLPVSAINLPNREYWLADERRVATMSRVAGQLGWFGTGTLALMFALLQLIDPVAMGGLDHMSARVFWSVFGVYGVFVAAFLVRMLSSYRLPRAS